ncbi:MAG: hypothetical protein IJ667_05735 [Synergistaceae bacterium]|nr:hypothetical protein [Synergistaceae bacterium]
MAYQVTDFTTVGQSKALAQRVVAGLAKKANLVTNLVAAGDLAMLTATGDIADSGIAQTGVMLAVANATQGTIPVIGANGQLSPTSFDVATDAEFTEMLDEVFGTAA